MPASLWKGCIALPSGRQALCGAFAGRRAEVKVMPREFRPILGSHGPCCADLGLGMGHVMPVLTTYWALIWPCGPHDPEPAGHDAAGAPATAIASRTRHLLAGSTGL